MTLVEELNMLSSINETLITIGFIFAGIGIISLICCFIIFLLQLKHPEWYYTIIYFDKSTEDNEE